MALILETGAGVTGAQTYATPAEFVAYAAVRGTTLTEAAAEPLLVAAMDRLSGLDYIGERVSRDQALDWPRRGVCVDGFSYAATEIPTLLKQALLALALAANTTDLQPVQSANAAGSMIEDTTGPLTTRWAPGRSNTTAIVPTAQKLLNKLLRSGGGAKLIRA